MTRRIAAALIGAGVAAAAPARAGPSLWDVARDPAVADAHELMEKAEAALAPKLRSEVGESLREALVLHKLEIAGAPEMKYPPLRYLYGMLLFGARVERYEEGREILERVLRADPDHPSADQAWFQVAIASAKLEEREREQRGYTNALEHAWRTGLRSTIYMNRAESSMMAGRLAEAIRGYERALALTTDAAQASLCQYGLAIAHERYGDLPSALEHAVLGWDAFEPYRTLAIRGFVPALIGVTRAIEMPSVFFVPEYETHYYVALELMGRAGREKDDERRLLLWDGAVERWSSYVAAADPREDPWVENARRHHDRASREVATLTKKLAGKTPRRPAPAR